MREGFPRGAGGTPPEAVPKETAPCPSARRHAQARGAVRDPPLGPAGPARRPGTATRGAGGEVDRSRDERRPRLRRGVRSRGDGGVRR